MKNLLLTLAAFLVLLLTGCQENSITDPVLPESTNKFQNTEDNISTGFIPLQGVLEVQGTPNSFYFIDGNVKYTYELIFVDPIPPAHQYYVKVNLSVNAVLSGISDISGNINYALSSESEDVFYVSEDGIYLLEKTYYLENGFEGMALVLRFLVTTDGIGLNSMWLSIIDNGVNKNSIPPDTVTYPPVRNYDIQ